MSVTGAVMAPRWTYIDPAIAFNPLISFQVVIMALLGGADKLWGPLLGVVPLVLLFEAINANFPNHFAIVLGLVARFPLGLFNSLLAGHQSFDLKNTAKFLSKVLYEAEVVLMMQGGGGIAAQQTATQDMYGSDLDWSVSQLVANATSFRFDGSDLMPGEVGAGSFWEQVSSYVAGSSDLDAAMQAIDASWPK